MTYSRIHTDSDTETDTGTGYTLKHHIVLGIDADLKTSMSGFTFAMLFRLVRNAHAISLVFFV